MLYHSSPAPCRSTRTTRRAPARSRPGPAPIGVGGRRRVGRPRSRFSRRRRRRRHGLHDGVAMNASRSCCLLRRATAPRRWLWLPQPRQAGQRRPDIARSVQKVEARTGPPLLARTCSGPRGAHRSPPRRLQCAPLRRSTHGFTERCFYETADFGTQAMLLLCIVVVASVRSLAIYATHFGLSGLVASVLGR